MVAQSHLLVFLSPAVQNISTTDGEASKEHRRLAARVRGPCLLVNHDELRHPLFVTASEVRPTFLFIVCSRLHCIASFEPERCEKNHLSSLFWLIFVRAAVFIYFFTSSPPPFGCFGEAKNVNFSIVRWFFLSRCRDLTEIMSTELKLILFVMLEHFLLLLAWLIHKAIPDRPSSVRIALARADYESKLALKREVLYTRWLIWFEFFHLHVNFSTWKRIRSN